MCLNKYCKYYRFLLIAWIHQYEILKIYYKSHDDLKKVMRISNENYLQKKKQKTILVSRNIFSLKHLRADTYQHRYVCRYSCDYKYTDLSFLYQRKVKFNVFTLVCMYNSAICLCVWINNFFSSTLVRMLECRRLRWSLAAIDPASWRYFCCCCLCFTKNKNYKNTMCA